VKKYIFLHIICFIISSSTAQVLDSTRPPELLDEVVITAQFKPTQIDRVITPVKVITSNQLKLTGAHQLRDALMQELSIDIAQASVFGGSPQINGISKENVKIMVNGIPVVGRLDGVIDLNQIPLVNVRRIEIIEGPSSVYHGTDALGGTINIITDIERKYPWSIQVGANYESIGAKEFKFNSSFNHHKHHLQTGANAYFFDGVSFNGQRAEDWENRNQYSGYFQYAYLMKRSGVQLRSQLTQDNLFDLGNADTNQIAKDVYYSTRRWVNSVHYNLSSGKAHYWDVDFSYSLYKRFQKYYTTDVTKDETTLDANQSAADTTGFFTWHGKATYSFTPENKWYQGLAGLEFNHETTTGRRILDRQQELGEGAVFAAVRLMPFKKLSLEPAVRWSHYSYGKSVPTPTLSVNYEFLPQSHIWANYSRGFRTPSMKELYLDFYTFVGPTSYHITGNSDLKPESSDQYQLGLKLVLPSIPLPHSIQVKTYYNDLKHLIALSPIIQNSRNYININHDKTYGIKWDAELTLWKYLSLSYGQHMFWNRNDFYTEALSSQLDKFLLSKDYNARIQYCVPSLHSTFAVYYKRRGERPAYAYDKAKKTYFATQTAALDNLDAMLSVHLFKHSIELNSGVKNILNKTNLEEQVLLSGAAHTSSLFLWGRTYFIGCQYFFNRKPTK